MRAKLTLMGDARLTDPSGKLIRVSPKAFGLAALIILSKDQVVSRSQAAELLWEPSERRFGNLRKLLWATKTSLKDHGIDLFVSSDDLIRLNETSTEVDVAQLLNMLPKPETAEAARLLTLYGGDLLENLPVDEPEFLDWLTVQRARLRNMVLTAISAHLLSEMGPFNGPARVAAARRVLEIDPYNESACRVLMTALAREGESAQLRDLFLTMTRKLAVDLATSPSATTTRLYRELTAAGSQDLTGTVRRPLPGSAWEERARPRPLSASLPALSLLRLADAGQGRATVIGSEALDNLEISLSRSKLLRIIAAGPTWTLQGDAAGWPVTYGITYAVHAALGQAGHATQLHIRLIEIAGRTVVWAERLSLDDRDPERCREMIASSTMSIINQIERHELAGAGEPEYRTPYHWYLAGRYCLRTMDLPSIRRGRRAFRTALELDADFIPAVVGTARALQLEWLLLARGDVEILAESENLARRAIRLDPEHAVAHRVLGFALLGRRSYPASAEAYDCADRLNPMHPDTLAEHGIMLTQTNQLEPGRAKLQMAFRLNPAPPDYYYWGMAWNQYLSGLSSETIETVGAMQNPSTAYRLLASSYARLGDHVMAQHYVAKELEIHPDFKVADWVPLVPLRDRQHIDYYTEGLRLAGFG